MFDNQKKLNLSELVDVNFLQKIQDVFAETMNIPSLTYDLEKPITKPSVFSAFCTTYTRGSKIGCERCLECDLKWSKIAAEKGEPVIYTCHAGLKDFAIPIIVESRHVGTIYGGQVLTSKPDENVFRNIAKELGINEDEYIEALRNVKIMSEENLKAAINVLFLVANTISEIGHKNLTLIKQNHKKEIYNTIVKTIRSSLDINDIKQKIVDVIGKTLNADRCFFVGYNKDAERFYIEKNKYLSSPEMAIPDNFDNNDNLPNFAKDIKAGKKIIIINKKILGESIETPYTQEKNACEKYGIQSLFAIPLYCAGEFFGALSAHYVNNSHNITDDEIELIESISEQIEISIHQAKLYNQIQNQAQREKSLRLIISSSVGCLELNKIIKSIIEETGKLLKADRCFFVEYDNENNSTLPLKDYAQYLSSDKIRSHVTRCAAESEIREFIKITKQKKITFVPDIYKEDLSEDTRRMLIDDLSVKSYLIMPVFYGDIMYGALVLHYVDNYAQLTKEDIDVAQAIANHSAIIINQAKLYEALKQTTANQRAILSNIPFMAWLKDTEGRLLAINEAYAKMCNSEVKDAIGKTDFDLFPSEHAMNYVKEDQIAMETKQTLASTDIIRGPKGERWHETYKSPVLDENGEVIGTAGIAQDVTKRREVELELMQKHEQIVKAASREKLLREIVSDICSTLDFNQIRKMLVTRLGQALECDLGVLYIFDPKTKAFTTIDEFSVYSSPQQTKTPVGHNIIKEYEWSSYIEKHEIKTIYYSDINDMKRELNLYGTNAEKSLDEYETKSTIMLPIMHAGIVLGILEMSYVQEPRTITKEDVALAEIVANQAAIALYQAKLYAQAQEATVLKDEFIANMSHELKTPLNIIIGFSEILANSDIDRQKGVEYLKNINKSGKHLLDLTNDIINISKIESGNFSLNYSEVDTKELITEIASAIKIMADSKQINIFLQLEAISVNADKKIFIQILQNLLNNAIKFTPNGGVIRIKSGYDNGNLVVSVEDTGIGIADADKNLIFEKFTQLKSTNEAIQQGSGLGLSIIKKLIELHNGTILVESQKGKGSNFIFTLPKAKINKIAECYENLT